MEIKSALIIMQTVVDHYSMDAAQREAWNTIRAILEEGQKPSTNTESMPCLVGINGQPCRLGWPCKCQAPACLIARTAYVS